jgi:ketosteroid isomerase-like protein
LGSAHIRASFEALFATGRLNIRPERVRKIESLAAIVHNVIERVEVMTEAGPREAYTTATNVYHKTPQGWRMVAHHASPGTRSEMQEASATPVVLH